MREEIDAKMSQINILKGDIESKIGEMFGSANSKYMGELNSMRTQYNNLVGHLEGQNSNIGKMKSYFEQ